MPLKDFPSITLHPAPNPTTDTEDAIHRDAEQQQMSSISAFELKGAEMRSISPPKSAYGSEVAYRSFKRSGTLLQRLEKQEEPVRVSIVGAGAMGKGLLHLSVQTPGIRVVALADLDVERAVECTEMLDLPYQVVQDQATMHAAIRAGKIALSSDGHLSATCASADIFIEASSAIGPAGRFCVQAIEDRKDVIMMNSEADLLFGPYLSHRASEKGLVYTSIDGDQHGVIKRLIDEMSLWGLDLVMAGNIKGYLDRRANPVSIVPEADKRDLDYKMCTAYTDGTKLNIEMALLANALGLTTPKVGMHGPRAEHVKEVFDLFDVGELYSAHGPVVDYILGAEPDGGVFVVGYSDDPYQQKMLRYYKMGEGPFYLLYRPYHLCHIEAMRTVAEVALDRQALLRPEKGFQTNVFAYAKKDLQAGDMLDGIGGHACYGLIENTGNQQVPSGLPICLAEDVTLRRDLSQDAPILWEDVVIDEERWDVRYFEKALTVAPSLQGEEDDPAPSFDK